MNQQNDFTLKYFVDDHQKKLLNEARIARLRKSSNLGSGHVLERFLLVAAELLIRTGTKLKGHFEHQYLQGNDHVQSQPEGANR